MPYPIIGCAADSTDKAQEALAGLLRRYKMVDIQKAPEAEVDRIVVLGGDGFMLDILHAHMDRSIPFYGMNCGTVGFLMNTYDEENLIERLDQAKSAMLYPLRMNASCVKGKTHQALAINEVSLLRQTSQTAHICVSVDHEVRLPNLMGDGILVCTPAGSTAYNLAVNGPIIPLNSDILAITPISPFRPRRWRGALVPHHLPIRFDILDPEKRSVSAVADFIEVRDVVSVEVQEDRTRHITLLFDPDHSLDERIVKEQFMP